MRSVLKTSLLAALLLLGACSSTTFVYNRLDFFVPWYLDDYVDLDSQQRRELDQLLTPFLAWHRTEELPRYLGLLRVIETDLQRPLQPADIERIFDGMQDAWLRLESASLDWLLALGDALSERQVQAFLAELARQQEELKEEYLERSEPEFRDDTYDDLEDNLQEWLGRLDDTQRERLQRASAEFERIDTVWLAERAAWLQQLAVLLQRRPGWQEALREAIAGREETADPRYLEGVRHNLALAFAAIADVLNSRTARQDAHLREKLGELQGDLELLIAEGKAEKSAA